MDNTRELAAPIAVRLKSAEGLGLEYMDLSEYVHAGIYSDLIAAGVPAQKAELVRVEIRESLRALSERYADIASSLHELRRAIDAAAELKRSAKPSESTFAID
jgi:hypothetical protein